MHQIPDPIAGFKQAYF